MSASQEVNGRPIVTYCGVSVTQWNQRPPIRVATGAAAEGQGNPLPRIHGSLSHLSSFMLPPKCVLDKRNPQKMPRAKSRFFTLSYSTGQQSSSETLKTMAWIAFLQVSGGRPEGTEHLDGSRR